jgi:hypothetical protein
MSHQKKRPLSEDAERLFQKMVQLVQEKGAEYQDWHQLTHEFLAYLGLTAQAVKNATEQIRLYAHQDRWCHPAMYVEGDKLFCAPDVVESWNAYRKDIDDSIPKSRPQ